jgi:hypothetical protein
VARKKETSSVREMILMGLADENSFNDVCVPDGKLFEHKRAWGVWVTDGDTVTDAAFEGLTLCDGVGVRVIETVAIILADGEMAVVGDFEIVRVALDDLVGETEIDLEIDELRVGVTD